MNLQVSMTKVFKIINGPSPLIMDIFFIFRKNTHNIRNFQIISNENKKAGTVRYSQETIKFRTPSQKKKKKKTLWPLFMDGVQLPQG